MVFGIDESTPKPISVLANFISNCKINIRILYIFLKVLEIEVQFVPEGKDAVRQFLESKGYILIIEIQPDYIFVHNSTFAELAGAEI